MLLWWGTKALVRTAQMRTQQMQVFALMTDCNCIHGEMQRKVTFQTFVTSYAIHVYIVHLEMLRQCEIVSNTITETITMALIYFNIRSTALYMIIFPFCDMQPSV